MSKIDRTTIVRGLILCAVCATVVILDILTRGRQ